MEEEKRGKLIKAVDAANSTRERIQTAAGEDKYKLASKQKPFLVPHALYLRI